jgi:hypothetical protein
MRTIASVAMGRGSSDAASTCSRGFAPGASGTTTTSNAAAASSARTRVATSAMISSGAAG